MILCTLYPVYPSSRGPLIFFPYVPIEEKDKPVQGPYSEPDLYGNIGRVR